MRTIEATATVTADRRLTIEVPADILPGPHHVVLVIDDRSAQTADPSAWPAGFFEQTYGSLADEPLVREPEGDYEIRERLG